MIHLMFSLYYIYLVILFLILILCLNKFGSFDFGSRIVYIIIFIGFVTEIISRFNEYKNVLYQVHTLAETYLILLYFLWTISRPKYLYFSVWCGIILVVLDFVNVKFFSHGEKLNTNMQTLESFLVVVMSLYTLYILILNDEKEKSPNDKHIWIWLCFLILYSGTFFFWGYINLLARSALARNIAQCLQLPINIIAYAGIGIAFLYYYKAERNGR